MITVSSATYQGVTPFDAEGNSHVNSAGDFFDPTAIVKEFPVFSMTRNVADWPVEACTCCQ